MQAGLIYIHSVKNLLYILKYSRFRGIFYSVSILGMFHLGRIAHFFKTNINLFEEVQLNSEIKSTLSIAEAMAQYDESAKRLLGQKSILARILVKTVEDFYGMDPVDVEGYIEGEPYISRVPLNPGLTNVKNTKSGSRLVGLNTENSEIAEGMIRFDIIFYVRIPSNNQDELAQIIVNVEAQKDEPDKYDILNRAIFYVCRMVSSQKERDFVNSKYNDIKKVYSIWVCMNMEENTMSHIHLTKDDILGHHEWKGRLDLLNIVMIGLGKQLPDNDDEYELHRLLGALFSQVLTSGEKIDILRTEYDIPMEYKEGVGQMCNLGEGIWERGIAQGKAEGKAEGIASVIYAMYDKGMSVEQISEVTGINFKEVESALLQSHILNSN